MIPKLEEVEMCLDRGLVDPNFNSYKLNLETLPIRYGLGRLFRQLILFPFPCSIGVHLVRYP
jgi:hypothetical protein